jgi:ketosteroid isomerase-like protein
MSQENVEIVRRAFETYTQHGADSASALLSDDVVWNPAEEEAQHGKDAVIAYMERWESEWEDLATTVQEIRDAGDKVLVTVHFSGRGPASGIEIDARLYEVYVVRDGQIVRMDEFTDHAEALEAAGLSE